MAEGAMSLWSRIKSKVSSGQEGGSPSSDPPRSVEPGAAVSPGAVWRDASSNPFGVPILDLTPVTQGMLSTTQDPALAQRAISWAGSIGSDLDATELRSASPLPCDLHYPVAPVLPDGLLFTPSCMEDKWVIAHRADAILAARSWTGIVEAVAETRRDGDILVVHALRVREGSVLHQFGDLVQVFDWLIRSHALGQVLPLPVGEQTMAILEETPLSAFPAFGARALCAARGFTPSPPDHPLRSDGAVLLAVRNGDVAQVRSLCRAGESVDAPTTFRGYTPLSVALVRGDVAMVRALLELGADPGARSDGGNFPLGHGIVHEAPLEALDALVGRGASPFDTNDDGFGLLHAAAESGNAQVIPWLLQKGLDLESRTGRGHTALQLACALGHVEAAEALLDAGADVQAGSPGGTARDIAATEGKEDVVVLLDRRASRLRRS